MRTAIPPLTAVPVQPAVAARPRDRLVFLPLVIAAILFGAGNEDFGFDPAGWLDSFMHLGYFWHYPAHLSGLDHDYKASRLPWILPGYVVHWLGDPAAASVVLGLSTLSAGGIALYLLVRDLTRDRAAAAVIAAAWTSCTWAHGIGGWNYQVLAATDYFLFATWLAFTAATTGAAWSAILTGVCLAAAGHTHLQFATFLPLLVLTYWSGLPGGTRRRVMRDGLLGAAGAIGITVVLAAINAGTGGDWLFFMPQLVRAQALMRQDIWWVEARTWVPTATYMILPIVFMVGGLAVLRRTGVAERPWAEPVLVFQAWLAFGIMCYTQFVRQKGTLDQSFLAFPVYAYPFPCLAVLLATGGNARRPARVIGACVIAIVAPLLLLMPSALPRLMTNAAGMFGATGTAPVVAPFAFALAGCAVTI